MAVLLLGPRVEEVGSELSGLSLFLKSFLSFFWLHRVFVAVKSFSSGIEQGLLSSCCQRASLRSTGSRHWASVVVVHGLQLPLWHMESSWTRGRTHVPCIGRWILNHWTTREVLG